jgi:hypothetical protein
MIVAVPPLMELIPAMLPFGVEIAPTIIGLAAVFAVIVNGPVQIRLGFLDGVLALRTIVGMGYGHRNKPRKRRHHDRCYCGLPNSLNHVCSFFSRHSAGLFFAPRTARIL